MTVILKTLATATALATLACAAPAPLEPRVACASGLYMIVARGSNEPAGEGRIAAVTSAVKQQVPGSISVAVDYPASILGGTLYPESVVKGINDAKKKVQDYVAACGANSHIVLLGYSQGGNVMSDMLAGGVLKPAPLDTSYHKYIKSVVTFADPTFVANKSYDYGSNAHGKNGIFSRSGNSGEMALLDAYSSIMATYCDVHDAVCASGDSTAVHGVEVENHTQEAINFIVAHK